jgi:MraZ protein
MAKGRHDHTMDAKGRVSIPAGFRMELEDPDGRPPVVTRLVDRTALGIFPAKRWAEIEERLKKMSTVQPKVQTVRRLLMGHAVDCPIDGNGRISIPQELRQVASLERDVSLLGTGDWVELWDRSALDATLDLPQDEAEAIASVAAEAGF